MFAVNPIVAEVEASAGGLLYIEEMSPEHFQLYLDRTSTGNNPSFVKEVRGDLGAAIQSARDYFESSPYCGPEAKAYLLRNRLPDWPGGLDADPVRPVEKEVV